MEMRKILAWIPKQVRDEDSYPLESTQTGESHPRSTLLYMCWSGDSTVEHTQVMDGNAV